MKGQNSTTEDHCSLIKEALIKTQDSHRKLMIIEGNAATGKLYYNYFKASFLDEGIDTPPYSD
jgi:hypothetical protein